MKSKFSILHTLIFLSIVSIALHSCKKDNQSNLPGPSLPESTPVYISSTDGGVYITDDYTFTNYPFKETDYIISCPVYILGGNTVVEPGTKIKFLGLESGIFVADSGSFTANGTAEMPIQFEGSETYAGSWSGIFFGTENENNKLEHCKIKYAGSLVVDFMDAKTSVGITRQKEEERNNCAWISNTEVMYSGGYGFYVSPLKGYFIDFYSNTVGASLMAPAGMPFSLAPKIGTGCELNPASAPNAFKYVFLFNDGFNQGIDINQPGTFKNLGIPYRIRGTEGVTLIGADITLEPGTVFEFDFEGGFCVKPGGSLKAIGTTEDPIIFKGIQGGNGKWVGLSFQSDSDNNALSNCIITGGGSKKSPLSDGKANIVLGSYTGQSGKVSVSNSQISHSGGWAIARKQSSQLSENNNQFIDNINQPNVFIYP